MFSKKKKQLYSFEFIQKKPSGFFRYLFLLLLLGIIGCIIVFVTLVRPPKNFAPDTIITVYSGMLSRDLAQVLETNNVVQSGQLFRLLLSTKINKKPIIAGDYIFEKPENIFSVLHRVNRGIYGNGRIRVTFPEGITAQQMSGILAQSLPDFNTADFLIKTKDKEGLLFPNTYYFFRTSTVDQVVDSLSSELNRVQMSLADYFNDQGMTKNKFGGKQRTWKEIITMASILEKEAYNAEEAKVIAGILWKRIDSGMPLQVDATFLYTHQKGSSSLTIKDLQTDNPYNTYTRKGLPVGPINNPGQAMIESALNPESSEYWYYLHGDDGKVRYGKTHDDHVANKRKYLK